MMGPSAGPSVGARTKILMARPRIRGSNRSESIPPVTTRGHEAVTDEDQNIVQKRRCNESVAREHFRRRPKTHGHPVDGTAEPQRRSGPWRSRSGRACTWRTRPAAEVSGHTFRSKDPRVADRSRIRRRKAARGRMRASERVQIGRRRRRRRARTDRDHENADVCCHPKHPSHLWQDPRWCT